MIVSLIAIVLLILVLTFVWPPDSPWSPWWRTDKKTARSACKLARIGKTDIVYELGSGDGEFILTAASEFGAKKSVGIEIDYSRHYIALLKKKVRRVDNVEFLRSDFKKIKLNDATVVYFYLVPAVIKRILPKLEKELRPGTRVVSYRYKVPLTLLKKEKRLYLYQI